MINNINKLHLTDIYRTPYSTTADHYFQVNMGHYPEQSMLGHKKSLKRNEIIQSMFSNHNGMKLEISNRRIFEKFTNM